METINTDSKQYIANMTLKQKCRWAAFIRAIQLINQKAVRLGKNPNKINLHNTVLFKTFIEPESEAMEFWFNETKNGSVDTFFLET